MDLHKACGLHHSFTRRGQKEAPRRTEVPTHVPVHGSNCICHICERHSRAGRAVA